MTVIPSEPKFRMNRALNIMELLLGVILEIVLERVLTKISSKRVAIWNTIKECVNAVREPISLFKFIFYFFVLPTGFPTLKKNRIKLWIKMYFDSLYDRKFSR
jgi:hypothetical protein